MNPFIEKPTTTDKLVVIGAYVVVLCHIALVAIRLYTLFV